MADTICSIASAKPCPARNRHRICWPAYANDRKCPTASSSKAPPNAASGGVVPWVHLEEPRTYGVRVGVNY